jgi:hypothetical protein
MSDALTSPGVEAYAALSRKIPVHLVWGSVDEFAYVFRVTAVLFYSVF